MLKNTTLVALSLVTVEIQFNFCDKTNNGKLWCCPLYPRYDNALWILCCSVESLISFITTAVLQPENVSIILYLESYHVRITFEICLYVLLMKIISMRAENKYVVIFWVLFENFMK